jgi:predicted aldo/keto reductase-like oxidoreductase
MTDTKTLSRNAVASWQAAEGDSLQAVSLNRTPSQGRYCAGCASVCESSVAENVPIADVMRHLMYARNYRDPARARAEFAALGRDCQAALVRQDYALAEQRCPQRLPIARLMQEALRELG